MQVSHFAPKDVVDYRERCLISVAFAEECDLYKVFQKITVYRNDEPEEDLCLCLISRATARKKFGQFEEHECQMLMTWMGDLQKDSRYTFKVKGEDEHDIVLGELETQRPLRIVELKKEHKTEFHLQSTYEVVTWEKKLVQVKQRVNGVMKDVPFALEEGEEERSVVVQPLRIEDTESILVVAVKGAAMTDRFGQTVEGGNKVVFQRRYEPCHEVGQVLREPSMPKTLRYGDCVKLQCWLDNATNKEMTVTLGMQSSEHLRARGESVWTLRVPAMTSCAHEYFLQCVKMGEAGVRLHCSVAEYGGIRESREVGCKVVKPSKPLTLLKEGTLEKDGAFAVRAQCCGELHLKLGRVCSLWWGDEYVGDVDEYHTDEPRTLYVQLLGEEEQREPQQQMASEMKRLEWSPRMPSVSYKVWGSVSAVFRESEGVVKVVRAFDNCVKMDNHWFVECGKVVLVKIRVVSTARNSSLKVLDSVCSAFVNEEESGNEFTLANIKAGVHFVSYRVKAVHRGSFIVPPCFVVDMDDLSQSGTSGSDFFVVE